MIECTLSKHPAGDEAPTPCSDLSEDVLHLKAETRMLLRSFGKDSTGARLLRARLVTRVTHIAYLSNCNNRLFWQHARNPFLLELLPASASLLQDADLDSPRSVLLEISL